MEFKKSSWLSKYSKQSKIYKIWINNMLYNFDYWSAGIWNLKFKENYYLWKKDFPWNLDTLTKEIVVFLECLTSVVDEQENPRKKVLVSLTDMTKEFYFQKDEQDIGYFVTNKGHYRWKLEDRVTYFYEDIEYWTPDVEYKWTLSFKEFYFLLQLYFWLYKETELYNKWLEKEKNWEYDDIVENTDKWINNEIEDDRFEEYYKLQIMKQDVSWAFNDLKVEKIFDNDWTDEKQLAEAEKINREFWEWTFELTEPWKYTRED